MSNRKDPAFLFYPSDFLVGTMRMTYEQKGKYIQLLCMQHDTGVLTQDDIDFVLSDKDNIVLKKFTKDNDIYYNDRLKEESEKRKAYSESRSKNRKSVTKDMSNICQTYDEHMVNINKDIDINRIKDINDTNKYFKIFWEMYPKKVGKQKCESWFKSKKVSQELFNDIISGLEKQKKHESWTKDNGKYIPHPMTWLNRGGWQDELDVSTEASKRWEAIKNMGDF